MFWLGLITTVAFIPGYTGATLHTGWVVLSLALIPFLWRESCRIALFWVSALVGLGALFSLRAPNAFDSVETLWHLGVFLLTALVIRPTPALWKGLAVGLTVSSAICILQAYHIHPVLHLNWTPSGLFFNQVILGAAVALTIAGLATERLWWYMPSLLPALWLSQSRGAWVALALGLVCIFWRSRWLLPTAIVATMGLMSHFMTSSDTERFDIWMVTISNLHFLGNGVGSYISLWFLSPRGFIHPEYAHNEYLELVFEWGAFGIVAVALAALAWWNSEARFWPVLCTFLFLAFFTYPLHTPVSVLIGASVLGSCIDLRRLNFLPRLSLQRPSWLPPRRAGLPIQL